MHKIDALGHPLWCDTTLNMVHAPRINLSIPVDAPRLVARFYMGDMLVEMKCNSATSSWISDPFLLTLDMLLPHVTLALSIYLHVTETTRATHGCARMVCGVCIMHQTWA